MWLYLTELTLDEVPESRVGHAWYGDLPFIAPSRGRLVGMMGMYVDNTIIIPELNIVMAIPGAVQSTEETSKPHGEEEYQKVTYLGVELEGDKTPGGAVMRLYLHKASYADTLLGRLEVQRPPAENNTPSMRLHFDPAERKPGRLEEYTVHIKYCQ